MPDDDTRSRPPPERGLASETAPLTADADTPPLVGDRVVEWIPPPRFEEYRLVRPLGRGTMGLVWLAHDQLLDRPVAIKFMAREPTAAARERFFVEARAVARLSHPNVVAIHRVGEVQRRPYLVSELLHGQALSELPRPMPPETVLEIGLALARGLAAAHRRGVLHRDIKPANAMRTDDGVVKLLDFGLAKLVDAEPEARPQPPRPSEATRASPELTMPGAVLGSPLYMAPEIWCGEPATRRSDVYSLGALLYELAHGSAPFDGLPWAELRRRVLESDAPPAPATEPRLAAVIARCLARDPAARPPSADAVRDALDELQGPTRPVALPAGNPYRGLNRFEAEHAQLFFGRAVETRDLLDRVRAEPMVLVAGDSGVGKSSLCRAGVLPLVAAGALGPDWAVARLVPGRRPLEALVAALAPLVDVDEAALAAEVRAEPAALARRLRRRGRVLVFVDQLEELVTLADADEGAAAAEGLAALAAPSEVRLLATARSDFLGRLAALPGLGDEVTRALYLLRPLDPDALHEAIVGPARALGVGFESPALVESLQKAAEHTEGGLPLLQFALSELWEARDQSRRLIPDSALLAIGGVGGALARHADGVIAGLLPGPRAAAQRILVRLVTAAGTRTRRSAEELGSDSDADARVALEALVRGRLVVALGADEAGYQIAHEALIEAWDSLRDWLRHGAERRALLGRLERAAEEWDRVGRVADALWSDRLLADVAALQPDELPARERGFLEASRRLARRRRWRRLGLIASVPLLVGAIWGGWALATRLQRSRSVRALLAEAEASFRNARASNQKVEELRARAFGHFDAGDTDGGERAWEEARAATAAADRLFGGASRALEGALQLDPTRVESRHLLCALLYERGLVAERDHQDERLDDILDRLRSCGDDGAHRRQWSAPAALSVTTDPAGARASLARYALRDATLVEVPLPPLGTTPVAKVVVPPGSYVLLLEAPGRAPVRLPLLLRRGAQEPLHLALPAAAAVPEGFLYVPPGRFLYGSADTEDMRRGFFNTVPLHELASDGYLIGRHEVTFADWIAWLRALPPHERARRMPRLGVKSNTVSATFELNELPGDRWRFVFRRADHTYEALDGEHIHYLQRHHHSDQDWLRFPVSAVSHDDALAYAAWLDASGQLPGAHLCDDYEWERAARGADGRHFPNGERLAPDDANIDETYGRRPLAFGPDEVGAHPGSRSPVGADDMAGNVWEWVRSVERPGGPVGRGGSWYLGQIVQRTMNRENGEPSQRDPNIGLRICAKAPPM